MAQTIGASREEKEPWSALSSTRAAAGEFEQALTALHRVNALDEALRREREVLQATTRVERGVAERAQLAAAQALAAESAMRETVLQLQKAQRELQVATVEKVDCWQSSNSKHEEIR